MSAKNMKWDGDADQQLLLAILAAHHLFLDHAAIASRLGPQCTPRAVQERLKKLKKMASDNGLGSVTDKDNDANGSIPTSGGTLMKKRAVPKNMTAPRKKKDAGNGTPAAAKKRKVDAGEGKKGGKGAKKSSVKVEADNEKDSVENDNAVAVATLLEQDHGGEGDEDGGDAIEADDEADPIELINAKHQKGIKRSADELEEDNGVFDDFLNMDTGNVEIEA
ncbi:MAG: hypothetical protein M1827_003490 [Pycnora praestabilis]|nr:MAG: hypothetical protein M1827_003490 [Pycnora praestabilis]